MIKQIYLAGGCFWGTEKYLSLVRGVCETDVGYANGNTENPSYEQVCRDNTGHAETVRVCYDSDEISLVRILELYYEVIDPTSLNKQGGDIGSQYRTGIYYVAPEDRAVIEKSVAELQKKFSDAVVIEIMPLANYYRAEEYHQKYHDKNPGGYCHISRQKLDGVKQ